jgi:hypothetical protein
MVDTFHNILNSSDLQELDKQLLKLKEKEDLLHCEPLKNILETLVEYEPKDHPLQSNSPNQQFLIILKFALETELGCLNREKTNLMLHGPFGLLRHLDFAERGPDAEQFLLSQI